jgi:hypothetical protein
LNLDDTNAHSLDTVYLKVHGYSAGDFAILWRMYATYGGGKEYDPPSPIRGLDAYGAIPLKEGEWRRSSLYMYGGNGKFSSFWFSFSATANTSYQVWFHDDFFAADASLGDIQANVYEGLDHLLFSSKDMEEDVPQIITLDSSGMVYIKVFYTYLHYDPANFSVKYSIVNQGDAQ